jgi:putative transposase
MNQRPPSNDTVAPIRHTASGAEIRWLQRAGLALRLVVHVDKLKRVYRKAVFWFRSYWIISCGGAPLSILKQYNPE